jgi:hypothetical protein
MNMNARDVLKMIDDNDRHATCDASTIIHARDAYDDTTLCDFICYAIRTFA